jgi:RNA polymerase sigma factor (sigma-70 family)
LAYLKTITIHEANTHFRLEAKPRKIVSIEQTKPDNKGKTTEGVDETAGPEERIILKDDIERLRGCLKSLPLVQQEIAMMKARDYKDSEIGEILGLPLGTVAVSYSRLKKKLRECMEKL